MPVGLDGNPNPVITEAHERVLSAVVRHVIAAASKQERLLMAIDGRSGAGKSTFADELASRFTTLGLATLRSTTDSFHQPRSERLRLGPSSPDGYYLDSHQLAAIVNELLAPFAEGAPSVRVGVFDEPSDEVVDKVAAVSGATLLIFDGLFLQRSELRSFWDHSVFLVADERLDRRWLEFLLADLPTGPSRRASLIDERLDRARWPRYRHGWTRYLEACRPAERACLVIDNNDLEAPAIVAPQG